MGGRLPYKRRVYKSKEVSEMTKIKDFQTARDTARRVKKAELDPSRVPELPVAVPAVSKAPKALRTKKGNKTK